jgi:hypothetical protein
MATLALPDPVFTPMFLICRYRIWSRSASAPFAHFP